MLLCFSGHRKASIIHSGYGAWWAGVAIVAALNALAVIPVSGFPSELPGGAKARMNDLRKKMAPTGRYADEELEHHDVDAAVIRSVLKSCWVSIDRLTSLPAFIQSNILGSGAQSHLRWSGDRSMHALLDDDGFRHLHADLPSESLQYSDAYD